LSLGENATSTPASQEALQAKIDKLSQLLRFEPPAMPAAPPEVQQFLVELSGQLHSVGLERRLDDWVNGLAADAYTTEAELRKQQEEIDKLAAYRRLLEQYSKLLGELAGSSGNSVIPP
jgi:hypothetical protein